MAIVKSTSLDSGLSCEYWRVISATRNMDTDKVSARIVCYKDKASRDDDKKYVLSTNVNLDASDLDLEVNLIEWVYAQIKDMTFDHVMQEPSMDLAVSLEGGTNA